MMTKLEAKRQVLENLIVYLRTANQRYVFPHFNEQEIKKLVKVSFEKAEKADAELIKVTKKLDELNAS